MSIHKAERRKPESDMGYQHPEVTELNVSSPTLSRLGKMVTLQWTAFNIAELECADANSSFLQSDGHEVQDTGAVFARAHENAPRS